VASIGSNVFFGCSSLSSVSIPDSVTSIGFQAFFGCSSLSSVSIPDSVTSIGDSAFNGCSSLSSVAIHEGVASIGIGAFYGCTSLASVSIPDSVASIGESAFSGCTSLASVSIPEGVVSISFGVFYGCSSLSSVSIPEGVASIGSYAFQGCSSLSSVSIPGSVATIGIAAFANCTSLSSVSIPEGVESIGDSAFYGLTFLATDGSLLSQTVYGLCGKMFWGPGDGILTELIVGDAISVEEFEYVVVSLTERTLSVKGYSGASAYVEVPGSVGPFSVVSIGTAAFQGCSSLSSVDIPSSVTYIGSSAFQGCSSLSSVDIPEGVAYIGSSAFRGCSSLSSVDIPGSVTSIGGYAFYGCSSLSSVEIPSSVTSIGSSAFQGCSSLPSVAIPEGVVSIWSYTFYGCSSLSSVDIPSSVTSIGDSAFQGCSSLSSVDIPSSVTSIGDSAFQGCSALASVVLGGGDLNIGQRAFSGCTGISSLLFHEEHNDVGHLTPVVRDGRTITIGNSAFEPLSVVLYGYTDSSAFSDYLVYQRIFKSYLDDGRWNCAGSSGNACSACWVILWMDNSLYLFDGRADGGQAPCSTGALPEDYRDVITAVIVGDGIRYVDEGSFSGSELVSRVVLGKDVSRIGSGAFCGCPELSTVYFTGPFSPDFGKKFLDSGGDVRIFYSIGDTSWYGIRWYNPGAYSMLDLWQAGDGAYKVQPYAYSADSVEHIPSVPVVDPEDPDSGYSRFVGANGLVYHIDPNPNGVASISGFENLGQGSENILIPDRIWYVDGAKGYYRTVAFIEPGAFSDVSSSLLRSITIPGTVADIAADSFSGCSNLEMLFFIGESRPSISGGTMSGDFRIVYRYDSFVDGLSIDADNPVMWGHPLSQAEPADRGGIDYTLDPRTMTAIVGKQTSPRVDNLSNTSGFTGEEAVIPDFIYSDSLLIYTVVGFDRYAFFNNSVTRTVQFGPYIGHIETEADPAVKDCTFREMSSLEGFSIRGGNAHYRVSGSTDSAGNQVTPGALYGESLSFDVKHDGRWTHKEVSPRLIKAPSNISSFEVEFGTKIIERYAFAGSGIQTVNLRGVEIVGSHAFYDCTDLRQVLTVSGEGKIRYLEDSAFENCPRMRGLDLSGVLYVGNLALYNTGISGQVALSERIMEIGDMAFSHNPGISSFVIGSGLENGYGYRAVSGILMKSVDRGYKIIQYPGSSARTDLSFDSLGAEIYEVAPYAFYDSDNLKSVALSDCTVVIGREAFAECDSLESFTFGTGYYGSDVVDMNGKYTYNMFGNDRALKGVTVPKGNVEFCSDGNGALYSKDLSVLYCYPAGIERVTYSLPAQTTTIYDCAFADNSSLRRIVVAASDDVYIGSSAFANCSRLAEVYYYCGSLPSTGEKIYDNAGPDDGRGGRDLTSYFGSGKGIVRSAYWQSRPVAEYSVIPELPQDLAQGETYAFVVVGTDGTAIEGADVYLYVDGKIEAVEIAEDGTSRNYDMRYTTNADGAALTEMSNLFYPNGEDVRNDVVIQVVKSGYYPYVQSVHLDENLMVSYVKLVLEPRVEPVSCYDEDLNAGNILINLGEMGCGYDLGATKDALSALGDSRDASGLFSFTEDSVNLKKKTECIDFEFAVYTDESIPIDRYTCVLKTFLGKEWTAEKGKRDTVLESMRSSTYTVSIPHDELEPGDVFSVYLYYKESEESPQVEAVDPALLNVTLIDLMMTEDQVIADIGNASADLRSNDSKLKDLLSCISQILPNGLSFDSKYGGISISVDGTTLTVSFDAGIKKSQTKVTGDTDCEAGYKENTWGKNGNTYRFRYVTPMLMEKKIGSNTIYTPIMKNGEMEMYTVNIWFAKGFGGDPVKYYRLSCYDSDGNPFMDPQFGVVKTKSDNRNVISMKSLMVLSKFVVSHDVLKQEYIPPDAAKTKVSKSLSLGLEGHMTFAYTDGKIRLVESKVKGTIEMNLSASCQLQVWVIPVTLEAELNAKGEAQLVFRYDSARDIVCLSESYLNVDISLYMSLAIGCKLVNAGVYGKANLSVDMNLVPLYFKEVSISGEVGLKAKFLWIEKRWPLLSSGKYYLYKYDGGATRAQMLRATPMFMTLSQTADGLKGETSLLSEGVDTTSEVFSVGDDRYMVRYVDATSDRAGLFKAGYDSWNCQKLRIDRLDASGGWVPVAAVDDNGYNDLSFRLVQGHGGTVLLMTQKSVKSAEGESNLYSMAGDTVVKIANLSRLGEGIVEIDGIGVGQTSYYKSTMDYWTDGDVECVAWAENSDNDLWGTSPYNYVDSNGEPHVFETTANSVWVATHDRGGWSAERVEGLSAVMDLAVFSTDAGRFLAAVVDVDGDISTSDGRLMVFEFGGEEPLFSTGEECSVLLVDGHSGGASYYVEGDDGSRRLVSYPSGDVLYEDDAGLLSSGYICIDGVAVVFVSPANDETQSQSISACMYGESRYGSPVTLVAPSSDRPGCTVSSLRAQSADGSLLLTWRYSGEEGESPSIEWRDVPLVSSLAESDVGFEVSYSGDVAHLVAHVINRSTADLSVQYSLSDRLVGDRLVVPSGSEVPLCMDVNALMDPFNLYIRWDGTNDYGFITLGAPLQVGYSDIVLTAKPVSLGGVDYIQVNLANHGVIDASGTVRCGPGVLDANDGRYVYESEFSGIGPGKHVSFRILAEPGVISAEGVVTVWADSVHERASYIGDNIAVVSISEVDAGLPEYASSSNGMAEDPILREYSGTYIVGLGQVLVDDDYITGGVTVSDPYDPERSIVVGEGLSFGFAAGEGNELVSIVVYDSDGNEVGGGYALDGRTVRVDPALLDCLDAGSYRVVATFASEGPSPASAGERAEKSLEYELDVVSGIKTARWYLEVGAEPVHQIAYVDRYAPSPDMYDVPYMAGFIGAWSASYSDDGISFTAEYSEAVKVTRILTKIGEPAALAYEYWPKTADSITFANFEGKAIPDVESSTFAIGPDTIVGWMLCGYTLDGEGRLLPPADPVRYDGAYAAVPMSDYLEGEGFALVAVYADGGAASIEVGDSFESGGLVYTVTSGSEVVVTGLADEGMASVAIPASVGYGGALFA
ncbi:MAG: leucine-rich repeat protein, partial [Candidatus Methanomethylophilaceae archaeon]|nr:leucine-rich repeat protein [Candidatus Methanomethylophilaceae archaeon]